MDDFFSDEVRRDPYPLYTRMRSSSAVHYVPPPLDGWLIFDYAGVKRALHDHETFSSRVPSPPHWFMFMDPPEHTKLRAIVSQAFTPRMVANLEATVRDLSRGLLDPLMERGEIDLAVDYSIPLPMMVIAGMIGIPAEEWPRFNRWSDIILKLSRTRSDIETAAAAIHEYRIVKAEMSEYLGGVIAQRQAVPKDDLLTRLIGAELDGQRLTHEEILGFFQLLIVAGQETTTNLINNAILCLTENPEQRELLERRGDFLPRAIEEVLRYRSPIQWMLRTPKHDVELQGKTIPAGAFVMAVIGSANRDETQFPQAARFDISRDPNAHVTFGHGIHFCLGAPLARMEARIALSDLLGRMKGIRLASDQPWEPRQALNVHGPARLPIRFEGAAIGA